MWCEYGQSPRLRWQKKVAFQWHLKWDRSKTQQDVRHERPGQPDRLCKGDACLIYVCLPACLSIRTTPASLPSQSDERETLQVREAHRNAINSGSLTNEHRDQERGVNTWRAAEHLQNHKELAFRLGMKAWMSESSFLSKTINKCFVEQPS